MSDTIRDRIAAAIDRRLTEEAVGHTYEVCLMAADAVIAELGLTQQFLVDGIISDGEPRPWEIPCDTRWTTEWERFDGTA